MTYIDDVLGIGPDQEHTLALLASRFALDSTTAVTIVAEAAAALRTHCSPCEFKLVEAVPLGTSAPASEVILSLKWKDAKDWKSVMFFPSKAIDMVWIAHRSFPMRYQHDMLAYCGHIIEPSLFLGQEAELLYGAALCEACLLGKQHPGPDAEAERRTWS